MFGALDPTAILENCGGSQKPYLMSEMAMRADLWRVNIFVS